MRTRGARPEAQNRHSYGSPDFLTASHRRATSVFLPDLKNRIEARLRALAAEIEQLVREEARAMLTGALGVWQQAPRTPSRVNGAGRPKAAPARPAPAARASAGTGRRNYKQMKRDMDVMVTYVRHHPGAKMEEIAKAIHSSSAKLNRPMHKLVESKVLTRKGERRASRYWVQ
jgi:hypothetical protein